MFIFFDITLLSVVLISTLFGFFAGMINSLISNIATIFSIFFAFVIYPIIKEFLVIYISPELLAEIISASLSYGFSILFCNTIKFLLMKLFFIISKGVIDRFLGVIYGFLRGVVIGVIIFSITILSMQDNYFKIDYMKDIDFDTKSQNDLWFYESITYKNFIRLNNNTKKKYPGLHNYIMSRKLSYFSELIDSYRSNERRNIINEKLSSLNKRIESYQIKK